MKLVFAIYCIFEPVLAVIVAISTPEFIPKNISTAGPTSTAAATEIDSYTVNDEIKAIFFKPEAWSIMGQFVVY